MSFDLPSRNLDHRINVKSQFFHLQPSLVEFVHDDATLTKQRISLSRLRMTRKQIRCQSIHIWVNVQGFSLCFDILTFSYLRPPPRAPMDALQM